MRTDDRHSHGISVVIPVYNAEKMLVELHQRLTAVLSSVSPEYEVIYVVDGSPDGSWDLLKLTASKDACCKPIKLMRNHGQHNALLCGIRNASYPVIITMDDDLQHPPEEIPKLLEEFAKGYDVVYGTFPQEQHGLARNLASRLTKMVLQQAMGVSAARNVSAFRIFKTDIREAFSGYRGPMPNIDVLLSWGTTSFGAAPVRQDARGTGASGYTIRKLVMHALNMITGFTVLPLQFASLTGFALTFIGIALLAFVLGRYFYSGTPIQGFPFLASVICFFSGAQLFALGILGEYFARMYLRLMDKPVYTEAERINLPDQGPARQ